VKENLLITMWKRTIFSWEDWKRRWLFCPVTHGEVVTGQAATNTYCLYMDRPEVRQLLWLGRKSWVYVRNLISYFFFFLGLNFWKWRGSIQLPGKRDTTALFSWIFFKRKEKKRLKRRRMISHAHYCLIYAVDIIIHLPFLRYELIERQVLKEMQINSRNFILATHTI